MILEVRNVCHSHSVTSITGKYLTDTLVLPVHQYSFFSERGTKETVRCSIYAQNSE